MTDSNNNVPSDNTAFYLSDRQIPLVYNGTPSDRPVLTCEHYIKWYSLYLVELDGSVITIDPPIDELEAENTENESVVGDHCWNPTVLRRWAEKKGWEIDDVSFEVVVGRWTLMREL